MSVILGLNCQEGIWLAADTRLTITRPGELSIVRDDFLKFESLGQFAHVVVAGDVRLGGFLIKKLKNSEFAEYNYTDFRALIVKRIQELLQEYPWFGAFSQRPKVFFLFGGVDPTKRKIINIKILAEYIKRKQETSSKPVQHRLHKSIIENMARKAMNHEKGSLIDTPFPYSGLCAVTVDTSLPDLEKMVSIEDGEYGQYFMFGQNNLTKEQVDPELFFDLDLAPQTGSEEQIIQKKVMGIVAFYKYDVIPRYHLTKVGGSITVFWITEQGAIFPTGNVGVYDKATNSIVKLSSFAVVDGKFYIDNNEGLRPLQTLEGYLDKQNAETELAAI